MIPVAPRGLGYYANSHWFLVSVALGLVLVFMLWLLSALRDAQELVEKMIVEQTVQSMRTGLKIAMGEAVVSMRDKEIGGWAGSNPLRWLASPPSDGSVLTCVQKRRQ